MSFKKIGILVLAFVALGMSTVQANDFDFNLLKATPVGSWQESEQITTSHKVKKTGTRTRSSLVGKEKRNGEMHYWLEMSAQEFKISKKGKRKNKGKGVIFKSLIPESLLNSDPANVMSNLSKFGAEVIVQNGNEDPMRIPDTKSLMAGVMQFANVDIQYDFEALGQETVTVPAGEFMAEKLAGKGSAEIKVIIKTIKVDSDLINWYSQKIPFGLIKSEGTSTTNGKTSQESTQLLEFGLTGAVSAITKPVQDMPATPGLDGLFGK